MTKAVGLDDIVSSESWTLHSRDPIHGVPKSVLAVLRTHPASILSKSHQMLHAHQFDEVPLCWRRAYEEATLWTVIALIRSKSLCWQRQVIERIDYALVMSGAPMRRDLFHTMLAATELTSHGEEGIEGPERKRRRLSPSANETEFLRSQNTRVPRVENAVCIMNRPQFGSFQEHARYKQTPIVLRGALQSWPALQTWKRAQHWLDVSLGGQRLVPVEIGRSYTDDAWGQKIMPFKTFIETWLTKDSSDADKGYLAQHDLFKQIPKLRSEVSIPDFCYIDAPGPASPREGDYYTPEDSNCTEEPLMNLWLGPAGTISPCHHDPHHNILAQVVGRKYVRLFAPSQSQKLHPRNLMDDPKQAARFKASGKVPPLVRWDNTSPIEMYACLDFGQIDSEERWQGLRDEHADFRQAEFVDHVLEPGECLYIPRGWWHFITSLDISASVSFWWD